MFYKNMPKNMSETIIKISNISKIYHLYNDPIDRLKEALDPFRRKYHHDFYALKNLNFEIKKGETIGIIGKNGAGKSTLLKILTGVLTPTTGECFVNGKVSSLLELGVGFNGDLSGYENIYFNGTILGYSKKEIDQKLDSIIDFADIGEFIYQPVKTYSSGMYVRLGFAIAINVDPDILIVDEALSVGDVRFQQKCLRKLKEFQENGKTIIFVSHDMGTIINYCDRAIWLKDGSINQDDSSEKVCKEYLAFMFYDNDTVKKNEKVLNDLGYIDSISSNLKLDNITNCSFFGEGGAQIKAVGLYSKLSGEKISTFTGGEAVDFYMDIEINKYIEHALVGFIMNDEYGNKILGINNNIIAIPIKNLKKGQRIIVKYSFDFPFLKNGKYFFSPAIAEGTQENHVQHNWVYDAYIVNIVNQDQNACMGWYFLLKDVSLSVDFS